MRGSAYLLKLVFGTQIILCITILNHAWKSRAFSSNLSPLFILSNPWHCSPRRGAYGKRCAYDVGLPMCHVSDWMTFCMQELLLDKTAFSSKTPQDQQLAQDVLMEANKFTQSFERLLGSLSSNDSPEAQKLMAESLEKMDVLNNSLALHKEVSSLCLTNCTFVIHMQQLTDWTIPSSRQVLIFVLLNQQRDSLQLRWRIVLD